MLTEQAAIEIYKYKLALLANPRYYYSNDKIPGQIAVRGRSAPLSKLYGVSSRAIRDVWNRQTWGYATSPLWHEEDTMSRMDQVFSSSSLQVWSAYLHFGAATDYQHVAAEGKQSNGSISATRRTQRISRFATSV